MRRHGRARIGRVAAVAVASLGLAMPGGSAAAPAFPGEIAIPGPDGTVIIPEASRVRPQDAGLRAHANLELFLPDGVRGRHTRPSGRFETPASLACVYGLVAPSPGCNPATATAVPGGGSHVIAIVDAYDDPNAAGDLAVFSAQFGLAPVTQADFQVVYATGTQPAQDPHGLWEVEESLDIEMAHAFAPGARVVLVEAASSNLKDLYAAVAVAAGIVAAAGGGEVSASWGGSETKGEESLESLFTGSGVVFVAAAGDGAGTNQPSVLQNVVAAGGTTIRRDADFDLLGQTAWKATGGGPSRFVPIPAYQAPIAGIVGSKRGVPDLSFDANPRSGVWVYDSFPYFGTVYDWQVIGGTSVGAPSLSAVLNDAGSFVPSSMAELSAIYGGFQNKRNWTDVRHGRCGAGGSLPALKGWDFCTGVGVVRGLSGK